MVSSGMRALGSQPSPVKKKSNIPGLQVRPLPVRDATWGTGPRGSPPEAMSGPAVGGDPEWGQDAQRAQAHSADRPVLQAHGWAFFAVRSVANLGSIHLVALARTSGRSAVQCARTAAGVPRGAVTAAAPLALLPHTVPDRHPPSPGQSGRRSRRRRRNLGPQWPRRRPPRSLPRGSAHIARYSRISTEARPRSRCARRNMRSTMMGQGHADRRDSSTTPGRPSEVDPAACGPGSGC